jgi:hypothetical protein
MTPHTDDHERRALWDEINALKRERAQLRRALATARGEANGGTAGTDGEAGGGAAGTDDDAADSEVAASEGCQHGRGNLQPRYLPRAKQSLRGLPWQVNGEAITLITLLATGDPDAWRGVKRARDMRRPLYFARVAHEYRLLFRVEGTTLVLVDIVQRSRLPHAIDQLRTRA